MNRSTRANLLDAIRRQEINNDVDRCRMVALAYPSEIKQGVVKGFFEPTYQETARVLNWYNLTIKGLEITKQLRSNLGIVHGAEENCDRLFSAM